MKKVIVYAIVAASIVVGGTIGNAASDTNKPEIVRVEASDGDYITVTTRGGPVYKIYGCGKLEKLEWVTLSPNEEDTLPAPFIPMPIFSGLGSITTTP